MKKSINKWKSEIKVGIENKSTNLKKLGFPDWSHDSKIKVRILRLKAKWTDKEKIWDWSWDFKIKIQFLKKNKGKI